MNEVVKAFAGVCAIVIMVFGTAWAVVEITYSMTHVGMTDDIDCHTYIHKHGHIVEIPCG
jgi:hypothetical protein